MTGTRSYDVIVIGLGAMGSATLFHLARSGARVLGLEQYQRGHGKGSSHGDSRIIREMYFEHPLYVPLVQRAHQLWLELETIAETPLMTINGGLMIGPADGSVVTGTLQSAREHELAYEILSARQIRERFPAFEPREDLVAVFDPNAGFLDPEACVTAHLDGAVRAGAVAHFSEKVIAWTADNAGVEVRTAVGSYSAKRLLLAAGAWTGGFVSGLRLPLAIERQVVFWLEPGDGGAYDSARFPIYAYEYQAGHICYGFPRLRRGVKASVMHSGEIARTPEEVRRTVEENEIESLRSALRPVLPMLTEAPVRDRDTCLFTNTPDHDFIIDWHPSHPNVLISSPCSGHGFKFSSAIGEIQASLLTEGTAGFDIAPFRIDRFG
ncbi:MAG TPA: N-methyl-L-tryptophan oxidase [Gemmatimonadaceae bacterium]|nr:N-methyl-L-tryptophan oxidase [Gemmatimonadaceae bacterium]